MCPLNPQADRFGGLVIIDAFHFLVKLDETGNK